MTFGNRKWCRFGTESKTATVGNDYVQQLVDGVICYTGEPSVLHGRAKGAEDSKKISKVEFYDKKGQFDQEGPSLWYAPGNAFSRRGKANSCGESKESVQAIW